jgi:hypothetical protein
VALSSDGSTALIGADSDNTNLGAVWVFTRSGSTWTQQGPKLTATGETGPGGFGRSVALSSDGNTALIGAYIDNAIVGAAWVFTRSGSAWTQQGSKLTGGGEIGRGEFGNSVALSSGGGTALVGGPQDREPFAGAVWVFVNGVGSGAPSTKYRVPKLKRKTLAQARRLLAQSHLKLGRVTSPKRHGRHTLVVVSQKPGPGKTLPAGSRIAVRLG